MTFSLATFKSQLPPEESVQNYWIGLSGGLDSVVLLHVMATLGLSTSINALHINHRISPYADQWQAHCESLCKNLNIPFYTHTVVVKKSGRGLEDAAREVRYEQFIQRLNTGDVFLTAHHANDQAETLLLRLMRGTGPRGLAGIAHRRPLGKGHICRPLLSFTREDLHAYAQTHQLTWVDDESNTDTHYDRNYLRAEIMPRLQERWPGFSQRWQQTADLCSDYELLVDDLAAEDLIRAQPRAERLGESLDRSYLNSLSIQRRQNLLRFWLRKLHDATPEQTHLQHIEAQLINGRDDSEAEVRWGNVILRRYQTKIYSMRLDAYQELAQSSSDKTPLSFAVKSAQSQELLISLSMHIALDYCPQVNAGDYLRADISSLEIRWRQGGERCHPQTRAHSQTLKRLLQEHCVEPWLRNLLPLIFVDGELAAVADLWINKGFAAEPGQPGYRVHWEFSSDEDSIQNNQR